MNPGLSLNAQDRLQALCKTISVAYDLDPEIQKELFGHLEDKALAYLQGEESLSEDDAVVLVREHFGDPGTLKSLLRAVHRRESQNALLRRLGAALTLFLALGTLGKLIHLAADFGVTVLTTVYNAPISISFSAVYPGILMTGVVTTVLLWAVLLRWQRRLDSGKPVWFMLWRASSIRLLLLLLVLAHQLTPSVSFEPTLLAKAHPAGFTQVLAIVFLGLSLLLFLAKMLAWLWWCDRPPRTLGRVSLAFGLMLGAMLLLNGLVILPAMQLSIVRTLPDFTVSPSLLLVQAPIASTSAWALLLFQPMIVFTSTWFPVGCYFLGTAAVAIFVYTLVKTGRRHYLLSR